MKTMNAILLSLVTFFMSCTTSSPTAKLEDGLYAEIKTNKGTIVAELFYQQTPVTVANFVSLAEGKNKFVSTEYKGKKYYDGVKFHRVINDFMIQTGDPSGTGSGSPGYKFKDEIVEELKHSDGGFLSMANAGPGTNGSQFFITHKATPWLDGMHTVFGKVVEGMDVVNAINQGDEIESVKIIAKGSSAKKFKADKVFEKYFNDFAKAQKEEEERNAKVIASKKALIEEAKVKGTKTQSGLIYYVVKQGDGEKPAYGQNVNVNYAGYFDDGNLFDTSWEDVATEYNQLDPRRKAADAYAPIPFKYGDKSGLIPGFIEGIENMNFGDKIMVIIPPYLGYGERGAGGVIPPNATLMFEMELLK
ncbi:peptidylprolyl isomerase [Flavobacterium agricola]|uniref:peptidylprolyl isomerase n=1 Tax=Flavobacterium agricola TaxID=2870839 RepID=A0ABY6M256_9FLAO|nr:peptidylprolyl isomerase [Flavobacterium agricola]UYW02521.1 peptidylprolyl isomerase [Flavobacterium agricola]